MVTPEEAREELAPLGDRELDALATVLVNIARLDDTPPGIRGWLQGHTQLIGMEQRRRRREWAELERDVLEGRVKTWWGESEPDGWRADDGEGTPPPPGDPRGESPGDAPGD